MSCFFFFKQKTAYEMRISDWSSDVCSSDLKKEDADKVFSGKILFAYERLPNWLQAARPIVRRDMSGELEFSNGSKIYVSLSHRSGTLQFLHVSEYGPMGAQIGRAHV